MKTVVMIALQMMTPYTGPEHRQYQICKCLVRLNIRKAETSTHPNRHENKSSAHID